jgi:NAD(P)-dependent dehydrogenase (short-subunit alcohol dehydrogenase family)
MSVTTDLKGRVALVTGSSSGIGATVAGAIAQLGASVVVHPASSVAAGRLEINDAAHYGVVLVTPTKARNALKWAGVLVARACDEVER